MKNPVLAAVLIASFVIPSNVFAQSGPAAAAAGRAAETLREAVALELGRAPSLPQDTKADWQARYDRASKMKRTGIVLFAVGAAALVGGVAWEFSVELSSNADPGAVAPKVTLVSGLVGIAGGLPLWLVGRHKMYDAQEGLSTAQASQQSLVLPLGDHDAITVTAHNGAIVAYRLSW